MVVDDEEGDNPSAAAAATATAIHPEDLASYNLSDVCKWIYFEGKHRLQHGFDRPLGMWLRGTRTGLWLNLANNHLLTMGCIETDDVYITHLNRFSLVLPNRKSLGLLLAKKPIL